MQQEAFTWFAAVDCGSEKHQGCVLDARGGIGFPNKWLPRVREVSDHAGSGWRSPWRPSPSASLHGVGTLDCKLFAAQYSARVFPCQRFAVILADANA